MMDRKLWIRVVSVSAALAGLSILSTGQAMPVYPTPSFGRMDTQSDAVAERLTKAPTTSDKAVITQLTSTSSGLPLLLHENVNATTAHQWTQTVLSPNVAAENWQRALDEVAMTVWANSNSSGHTIYMDGKSCGPHGCSEGFAPGTASPLPSYVRGLVPNSGSPYWSEFARNNVAQQHYNEDALYLNAVRAGDSAAQMPGWVKPIFEADLPKVETDTQEYNEYQNYLRARRTNPDAKSPVWVAPVVEREAQAEVQIKAQAEAEMKADLLKSDEARFAEAAEVKTDTQKYDEYQNYLRTRRTNPDAKMPAWAAAAIKNYKTNVEHYDEFQHYLAETSVDPSVAKRPPPAWAAKAIEDYLTTSFGVWAN
jgi:hypothetical protein